MASKRATPRSRKSQRLSAADRRRTILDAALRRFAERGYEGASVDDIAADAGINVSVIYSHFKSKQDLHATVLQEQWESLVAYQAPLVLAIPPGREWLRAAYTSFFEWCEQNPLAWRLVFREVGGPAAVVRAHERILGQLTDAIVGVLATEDPADPRLASEPGIVIVAEWLKGGMNAVARWWSDNPSVGRQEIIDLLVDVIWIGFEPLGVEGKKERARR
jgi:AcrR family transcriptional regulator